MNVAAVTAPADVPQVLDPAATRKVIFASSIGTIFEYYDFYLYGTLAVFFGGLFFPPGNDKAALLASLATFGAGFGVRPLGAIVFGRLGDLIGRKYTFLLTVVIMGLATALTGFLPTYAQIGMWAPALLVFLRLAQGLALGGEYGGAATYVAEHAPDNQRGHYTSYIQTAATIGFFISLAVIASTRIYFGPEDFKAFGWRIPFLLSFILLGVSLYVRLKMEESPVFAKLKAAGKVSKNPLKESFGNKKNLKFVLLALFGATAGQGVVWYCGQFYALTFLQKPLNLSWQLSYVLVAIALAIGTPSFVYFGKLSDRIGRKHLMMAGFFIAALTYIPIYMGITALANPTGLPEVTSLPMANMIGIVALLTLQIVYVGITYGPIAAFLVELFPTSIRYTSMSLPYHLGLGWFGGFLPLIATATSTSDWAQEHFGSNAIYTGFIYACGVCLMTGIVGSLLIKETKDHKIDTPMH
ncbi:MAG: MFS transporter [Steroidobacteraceae bacterium]